MAGIIDSIRNIPLSEVQFAEDCLLLLFGENKLHFYEWPDVHLQGAVYAYEDEAYESMLRSLVAKPVTELVFSEGEELTLYFGDDRLSLMLEEDEELVYIKNNKGDWEAF